jgi:hypothetical protein
MASDRVGSLGPSLEIRNTNWSAKKKKKKTEPAKEFLGFQVLYIINGH